MTSQLNVTDIEGLSNVNGKPLIFTKSFESSEIVMGNFAVNSISHGLGGLPTLMQLFARCKIAEFGYSVGDEINIAATHFNGSNNYAGNMISADGTEITVLQGNETTILRKDSGASVSTLTNASWRLVVRAWA